MKLTIIVPSAQYLSQAGARIRYQRMEAPLARLGWAIELLPIDALGDLRADRSQAYLFSKCQDARALAVAVEARAAGIVVGVDLFDDYFSQRMDARFAPQRHWLRAMAESADFFLCSTPRMRAIGEGYFAGRPGHVLNDPFGYFEPNRLAGELERKREKALRERKIDVLWFGMGDNPNFPVGLHDLVAFAELMRPLSRDGFIAELTILTNARALDPAGLALLRRLSLPFSLVEWSEDREAEALAQNLVSFIPVNAQPFSIAKSLNRGVSALTGGTQLLSAGYPLYGALDDFTYRDAAALLGDLRGGELRLSGRSIDAFSSCIRQLSDPDGEAEAFARFLDSVIAGRGPMSPQTDRIALLHGAQTTAGIHKFAQRRGWLSLASPFTPPGIPFDAHLGFFGEDGGLRLRLSKQASDLLPKSLRSLAASAPSAPSARGKGPALELPLHAAGFALPSVGVATGWNGADRASLHDAVMDHTRRAFEALFGGLRLIQSELDPAINAARPVA